MRVFAFVANHLARSPTYTALPEWLFSFAAPPPIGTNAVVFGATGFGGVSNQDPASAQDIATVAQRLVIT